MIAVHHIVTDPVEMTVTVGPRVYDRPMLDRLPEKWTSLKADICGTIDDAPGAKEMYQRYAFLLGPRFNKRFQAANYWLWVGNRMTTRVANMLRCEGRHWKRYHSTLVWRSNKVLPYVNEAERDGLFHLVPAIVAFEASPQEIKRRIGQGAWRRVAANSISRNCRLMHASERIRPLRGGLESPIDDEAFIRLLDFPSGVLRAVFGVQENEIVAARITPLKRAAEFTQTVHMVRDTKRMTAPDFNPNWSYKRMVEEHDKAVKAVMQNRYSSKRFAPDWSFEHEGFTATLLTSKLDIATEGATQHHCVGSYAGNAANGQYVVLRIEGKERATAGLNRSKHGCHVDQIYAACNKPVSDACQAFVRKAATAYAAVLSEKVAA